MSVNQGGIYKGLISSAVVFTFSPMCGIISPYFFVDEYGPKYYFGNIFAIGLLVLSMLLTFFLAAYFKKSNDTRENNPINIKDISEIEQRKMVDKHPNFRYTV
ncbi:hypothetical protein AYI68_g5851 [Smittium mucronatum]|uniref:Transporter n=1 Tax=Smittium mucronatum TaxID=133383 RepID=A0A1R0GT35_9FUNG|nr:hypothetical protein AYI68_g5851 [Smittium mucronatum]